MDILILAAMGSIAGLFAGLLGIGGGIIIVPVLAVVFEYQGVNIDVLMHVSIGTSLATIVITSLSSIRSHHKHKAINWDVVRTIAGGVFVGGLIGALVAKMITGDLLQTLFAIFMMLISIQMFFGNTAKPHRRLPKPPGMIATGTTIGIISSVMGVGGGSMSVPFLTWCNMSIRNAVATSSAIGFPIAVSGTIGFIITGWSVIDRPPISVGYVNIPAFLSIVIASTIFAPLGVKIAHRLSPSRLKRLFALFILILALRMLFS